MGHSLLYLRKTAVLQKNDEIAYIFAVSTTDSDEVEIACDALGIPKVIRGNQVIWVFF